MRKGLFLNSLKNSAKNFKILLEMLFENRLKFLDLTQQYLTKVREIAFQLKLYHYFHNRELEFVNLSENRIRIVQAN